MSRWDKLIMRICSLSKDLRFDELRKVLESYGYVMNAPKGGSSHYTFRKSGCMPITIPKHEPIEEYSGQFKLRIPKSLHRSLAEHSKKEGISMNQYCVYLLAKNDAVYSK